MTVHRVYPLTALAVTIFSTMVFAQTTSFKYQGSLTDAGSPANGNFQMQFKLFDALSGGAQIGGTLTDLPVTATNGVFAVSLDFGASALSGANRWIEISVRRNSGESYVTLSPREQIASSPYAVRTLSAASADLALDSQKLGGLNANEYVTTTSAGTSFIKNDTVLQTGNFNISGTGRVGGNLGVGTTSPATKLDVAGGSGDAVRGISTAGGRGVWGESNSWQGVYGKSTGNAGVAGESTNQYGVFGVSNNAGASGVYGSNNAATGTGVIGQTASGNGVYGFSGTNGRGVFGESNTWQGVFGKSNTQAGVAGESNTFYGVFGVTSGIAASGIYGSNNAVGGTGILGQSNGGKAIAGLATNAGGVGVWGQSDTSGRAIHAEGKATQNLDGLGLPKAMVFVLANGTIGRCYNGVTGASSGGCGFTVTHPAGNTYTVNFNMNVSARFYSMTSSSIALPGGIEPLVGRLGLDGATPNLISASFWRSSDLTLFPSDFTLIVY